MIVRVDSKGFFASIKGLAALCEVVQVEAGKPERNLSWGDGWFGLWIFNLSSFPVIFIIHLPYLSIP